MTVPGQESSIRLGLHIASYSYGTDVAELFATVSAQAQEAEAAGFDAVFVVDHFYPIPIVGTADQPMLEAYTTLGALANATQTVQLGTLVTCNTFRNPALLAKAVTTLDVISRGRATLGIGTGWFALEHEQLGFDFGTFVERFDKLDEALQIIVPMLGGARPTFAGKYYRTSEAINEPRFRSHIPLLIGGSGEKKTIPLAVRHFDHFNIMAGFDQLPRKIQVINEQCESAGRDPATLDTTMLLTVLVDENATTDSVPEDMKQGMVAGSAEHIAEQIKTKVLDHGVGGVIMNLPTHVSGYQPGHITAIGEALKPLVTAGG